MHVESAYIRKKRGSQTQVRKLDPNLGENFRKRGRSKALPETEWRERG